MAKGIGLIGNFKGKVGNMVGYKNSASNTANTQGIRVYQPIVKNPKTAAQAEQRAKLAPINATYRALKMIIDRGNEGLPYGNKSRLAWLKQAFKAEKMPWIEKGKVVNYPVACQLTKGSLASLDYEINDVDLVITVPDLAEGTQVATVGALSTVLISSNLGLKNGDQLTFVVSDNVDNYLDIKVFSIVLDTTSTASNTLLTAAAGQILFTTEHSIQCAAIIISRQGDNGEHLRSNESLMLVVGTTGSAPYNAASKTAAIDSYMNSAAVNSDWAEESIQ